VRRLALFALAVVTALLISTVSAGERTHVVKPGESASAIAEQEYGDRRLGDLLLAFNGRLGKMIHPGEALRVPFCDMHRVRSGESWSVLAQKYMKGTAGWRAIAELNGLDPDEPLAVGQEIVFPVVAEAKLERGTTLAVLAQRFYGDPARGRLLQEYNDLDDAKRLAVGATIRVPLTTLRRVKSSAPAPKDVVAQAVPKKPAPEPVPKATPSPVEIEAPKPTPMPTPPPTPEPAPVSMFGPDLATAKQEFRRGAYDDAVALLEELREPVMLTGSEAERRELLRLLAFVYVAFDNEEEACAAYGALTRIDSVPVLDPDLVSPKIRNVLAACVSPA
jgi:LysM repeat protein